MEVQIKLKEFDIEIAKAKKSIEDLILYKQQWSLENKKSIKSLYPEKGKIYKINKWNGDYIGRDYENKDLSGVDFYLKIRDIRFCPHIDFDGYLGQGRNKGDPTVLGELLDHNFKIIREGFRESIFNLSSVNVLSTSLDRVTKVYIMIDKNTGYYKIGRSNNPMIREKTLQSEKPTIEMLNMYDARVRNEKDLHDMFEDKRVRGEWFDLCGSDLQRIASYFDALK